MQGDKNLFEYRTSNIKEFADKAQITSEQLCELLEDFPDLNFNRHRRNNPRYRTLIASDVEQIIAILPKSKRELLLL